MLESNRTTDWLGTRLAENHALASDDFEALRTLPTGVKSFEPGQYLLREGDRPKHSSFLLSGFIFRHKLVGDGGRQIVAVHLPRDFIDVQQALLPVADHNIQALTAGELLVIQSDALIALVKRRPSIAIAFWHQMQVEASIVREGIANIGRRDARTRTAHWLCELALRSEAAQLGIRDAFELPMTQEQIGDALGLTAVHVNRTLKSLTAEGTITRNKRAVKITDWRALQQIGDFTSGYLHLSNHSPT